MPKHKKETEGVVTPRPDFQYTGGFEKAVVVVSNMVSRATTRWNLEEGKMFMLAVSQIENRDDDCCVRLRKKDVFQALDMDPRNAAGLKKTLQGMQDKSKIVLQGKKADEWDRGLLVRHVRTDRYYAWVQFDDFYLPLLHYVKDELFTKFDIPSIIGLKHKSSYNLYLYLTSWHNGNYEVNARNINKSDLPKVFNLSEGQYWRNYGTDKAKFHWTDFENRCLKPAIEDINSNPNCDMQILKCKKIKDPHNMRTVLGYAIGWQYQNPDGSLKTSDQVARLINPEEELSIEEKSNIEFFMRKFRKLSDRQLKALSVSLGRLEWNDQLAWDVGELKTEREQKCISPQLYDRIRKVAGWSFDGMMEFAPRFGYEPSDEGVNMFTDDLDAVGKRIFLMR